MYVSVLSNVRMPQFSCGLQWLRTVYAYLDQCCHVHIMQLLVAELLYPQHTISKDILNPQVEPAPCWIPCRYNLWHILLQHIIIEFPHQTQDIWFLTIVLIMLLFTFPTVSSRLFADVCSCHHLQAHPISLPCPNSGIDAVKLSDGRLLTSFNDMWDTDEELAKTCPRFRCRLSVAISNDDGESW